MPRMQRNFKLRAAKFLLLNPHKYQKTGTATGHYKGAPVSERRLQYAKNPRSRIHMPLLDSILGSPIDKGRANESYAAKRDNSVFLFKNTRTNQVVYSLTGHLDPEIALPQLTFYGKKTIPSKYRKDDWSPFMAVRLPSREAAMLCYWTLQDLRMLRDYAWRETNKNNPPREILTRKLMDQVGSSVCDVSTAIKTIMAPVTVANSHYLVQWRAVEELANEAKWGGLNILRKQISRAQRVLVSKKKDKKFPTPESLVKLREYMREWYDMQTMMIKAVKVVDKVRRLEDHVKARVKTGGTERQKSQNGISRLTSRDLKEFGIKNPDAPGAPAYLNAEETKPFKNENFTTAYGVQTETPMAHLLYKVAMCKLAESGIEVESVIDTVLLEHNAQEEAWNKHLHAFGKAGQTRDNTKLDDLAGQIESTLRKSEKLHAQIQSLKIPTNAESAPITTPFATIFWSSTSDRKYTRSWPAFVKHMGMGPRQGRDQYFSPRLQEFEDNAHHWVDQAFTGDEDIAEEVRLVKGKKQKKVDPNLPFEKQAGLKDEEVQAWKVWKRINRQKDEAGAQEFLKNPEFKETLEKKVVRLHYMDYLSKIHKDSKAHPTVANALRRPSKKTPATLLTDESLPKIENARL